MEGTIWVKFHTYRISLILMKFELEFAELKFVLTLCPALPCVSDFGRGIKYC